MGRFSLIDLLRRKKKTQQGKERQVYYPVRRSCVRGWLDTIVAARAIMLPKQELGVSLIKQRELEEDVAEEGKINDESIQVAPSYC